MKGPPSTSVVDAGDGPVGWIGLGCARGARGWSGAAAGRGRWAASPLARQAERLGAQLGVGLELALEAGDVVEHLAGVHGRSPPWGWCGGLGGRPRGSMCGRR